MGDRGPQAAADSSPLGVDGCFLVSSWLGLMVASCCLLDLVLPSSTSERGCAALMYFSGQRSAAVLRTGWSPSAVREMKLIIATLAAVLLTQVNAWRLRRSLTLYGARRQGARAHMAMRHEALLFTRQLLQKRLGAREHSLVSASSESAFQLLSATQRIHKTAYWGTMSLGTPPQHFKNDIRHRQRYSHSAQR